MAIGKLNSLKTSALSGINTAYPLFTSQSELLSVNVDICNQGEDEAAFTLGICTNSAAANTEDSEKIFAGQRLKANEYLRLSNVGIRSGDTIFAEASKAGVSFLVTGAINYNTELVADNFGRGTTRRIGITTFHKNVDQPLFVATRPTRLRLYATNDNNTNAARITVGISTGHIRELTDADYIQYNVPLALRDTHIIDEIYLRDGQTLSVKSNYEDVNFLSVAEPVDSAGISSFANLNVTGILTATTLTGDGSGLTGIVGSGSGVIVKDDDVTVGTAGTINFGDNLSVSPIVAGLVTVTASGGGGSGITTDNIKADTISVSGIVTASSFVGGLNAASLTGALPAISGANLTGLTGATANTYGSGTLVPEITVDANGKITTIQNVAITAGGGGGGSASNLIEVRDSGSSIGFAGTINFGDRISVSDLSAGVCTVTGSNSVATATDCTNASALLVSNQTADAGRVITFAGTTAADVNAAVFGNNNFKYNPALDQVTVGVVTGATYYGDGSNLTGVGAAVARGTVNSSTGSIGAGTTSNITITGYKSYHLLKVGISSAAWVRLYTDSDSRTADATRHYTSDPDPGAGVLAEVRTTGAGSSTLIMSPAVVGWNNDGTPSTNIYAAVTNNESSDSNITVTLTVIKIED